MNYLIMFDYIQRVEYESREFCLKYKEYIKYKRGRVPPAFEMKNGNVIWFVPRSLYDKWRLGKTFSKEKIHHFNDHGDLVIEEEYIK